MAFGGFYSIPAGGTRTFSVENMAATIYVSVAHPYTLDVVDVPFDPKVYGCMAILYDNGIAVSPYNPEATWIPAKTGDQLLIAGDVIEAGLGRYKEHLYFGRKASLNGGMPCAVTSNDGKVCSMWLMVGNITQESGELLKNTGFELIRAKRGDPIPPNAIMSGVTKADGSLFVGRVGGSIPCYITTDSGKIQSFVYGLVGKEEERVSSGEVMVLTR